jgi:hypothetical protein
VLTVDVEEVKDAVDDGVLDEQFRGWIGDPETLLETAE